MEDKKPKKIFARLKGVPTKVKSSCKRIFQNLRSIQQKFAKLNRNEKFFVAYLLGMLIYGILISSFTIAGLCHLAVLKNSQEYERAQSVVENWKKNYVSDLITVQGAQCPTGYENWSGLTWPGINSGCSCINTSGSFPKMVFPSQCTSAELVTNCVNIPSIGSMNLDLWTGGIALCVQRGTTSLMTSPSECGNGYQRCGQDGVLFCVQVGEECPISELFVSASIQYGYESQSFSNGTKIYFKRNTTSFPLADYRLTEYSYCVDENITNISPGRLDYVLAKTQRTISCGFNETRYVTIGQLGEKDFYIVNDLYDTVAAIPGYPMPNNDYIYLLGFVNYFRWNEGCRNGQLSLENAEMHFELNPLWLVAWLTLGFSVVVGGIIVGCCLPYRLYSSKWKNPKRARVPQKKKNKKSKENFWNLDFIDGIDPEEEKTPNLDIKPFSEENERLHEDENFAYNQEKQHNQHDTKDQGNGIKRDKVDRIDLEDDHQIISDKNSENNHINSQQIPDVHHIDEFPSKDLQMSNQSNTTNETNSYHGMTKKQYESHYTTDKISKFLIFPFILSGWFYSRKDLLWYQDVRNFDCTDQVNYQIIAKYEDKISDAKACYLACMIIWILMLALDFIYSSLSVGKDVLHKIRAKRQVYVQSKDSNKKRRQLNAFKEPEQEQKNSDPDPQLQQQLPKERNPQESKDKSDAHDFK